MKLAITQHNLNERGGAERVILKIAQKYDATIYTLGYDRDGTFDEFKDMDVRVFKSRGKLSRVLPPRIANAIYYGYNFYNLKIDDYDVVNPHMSPSEWARNRNPRALWYCHTPPRELYDPSVANLRDRSLKEKLLYRGLSKVYNRMERDMVKRIEAIATNSENTRQRIKKHLHHDASVINPAVDYRDFRDKGDGKYFLYPSRIAAQKRQEYAIGAFQRFMRNSKDKNYRLIIAGGLSKRYSDFEEYFKKLKGMHAGNVTFKLNPSNGELRDLYSRCTAVLFTAINEDFGIVPLEGMSSSKPVISVNEGGPKETIINGKTGFLVNSTEEMAHKMSVVASDSSLAHSMGLYGRKRVERNYSWKVFFKRFDALARKVSRM
ncbi:MAG: glycosyltransferase [Candidatus Micrarchaeaceae archaeon]